MQRETIIFHHIPKTAGTTFYSILENQYEPSERFRIDGLAPASSLSIFQAKSLVERNSYKIIYGHLADHFQSLITTTPIRIIFLREPIDHFISSFFFIKRSEYNRYHKQVKNLSINEYIDLRIQEGLDNLQTRHIGGATSFLLQSEQRNNQAVSMDVTFRIAEHQLKTTNFVLLTERFDESIMLLYEKLKWSHLPFYRKQNQTKKRPVVESFDSKIIDRIAEINQWDMKLYALAVEKFNETLALHSKTFEKRSRLFSRKNSMLNKTGLIHIVGR